jgi:hypothetical protein
MNNFTSLIFAALILGPVSFSFADTKEVKESVNEAAQDTSKEIKKGSHRVQEKACEMVNGKLQCLPEKAKHRASEASDEVKDLAK